MTETAQTPSAPAAPAGPLRLNLGAGRIHLDGYVDIDIRSGGTAYPLPQYADNSVDEIIASHVLEHFSHRETAKVLAEWLRVLKPGAPLKIAVPNFDWIHDAYAKGGVDAPIECYLMGSHDDEHDVHLAVFNPTKLRMLLDRAGFIGIGPWVDVPADSCATLKVSLNMRCTKPPPDHERPFLVVACETVPRYGSTATMMAAINALGRNSIDVRHTGGAFWEQCLEKALEISVAKAFDPDAPNPLPDAILTFDYDSLFDAADVAELIRLLRAHPEIDALAALQTNRHTKDPLFTIRGPSGQNRAQVDITEFKPDVLQVATAHFGLTLIRVSSLVKLPHPWFFGTPAADGRWTYGQCTDPDINFWRKWEAHKFTVYLAPHVVIGHIVEFAWWPGPAMKAVAQPVSEYFAHGKPKEVWQ